MKLRLILFQLFSSMFYLGLMFLCENKLYSTLCFFLLFLTLPLQNIGFSNVSGTKDWNHKDSWNGTIIDVADIEENIWAPRLGIKGKVDVTVKTSARNKQRVKHFHVTFKNCKAIILNVQFYLHVLDFNLTKRGVKLSARFS